MWHRCEFPGEKRPDIGFRGLKVCGLGIRCREDNAGLAGADCASACSLGDRAPGECASTETRLLRTKRYYALIQAIEDLWLVDD
jgi:hypothetical protein